MPPETLDSLRPDPSRHPDRPGYIDSVEGGIVEGWLDTGLNLGEDIRIQAVGREAHRIAASLPRDDLHDTPSARAFTFPLPSHFRPGDEVWFYAGESNRELGGFNPYTVPGAGEDIDMERDQIRDMIAVSVAESDTKFERLRGEMSMISEKLNNISREIAVSRAESAQYAREARSSNITTRITIGVTVVASVVAALAALWSAQANLLSAFQAGIALKSAVSTEKPEASKPTP